MKNKFVVIIILAAVLGIFPRTGFCADLDNGTGADGVAVICSKTMAMRCSLSSGDIGDVQKIKECLDKIASDSYGSQAYKQNVNETGEKIIHECSKIYYELAVKYKANAGDYVDKGDENGNFDLKTDKHGKKEQEGQISASNAKNLVGIMDVYASLVYLEAIQNVFGNLTNREISEDMKSTGEDNLKIEETSEPSAEGDGNE